MDMARFNMRGWFTSQFHHPNGLMLKEDNQGDVLRWIAEGQNIIPMLSTGLRDKHGVEVFDGDIVNDHYVGKGVVEIGEYGWKVNYYDVGPCLTGKHFGDFLSSEWACVEVIGNIHENPELMKG